MFRHSVLRDVLLLISIAHELRAWLLHYSPVVLYGVLPDMFYQHHLLLVEAIFLLLQDAVQDSDVKQSQRILQHYCFMFGPLYGTCTLIALLLHVCFKVRFKVHVVCMHLATKIAEYRYVHLQGSRCITTAKAFVIQCSAVL